jgi:hypothetical protein
MFPSFHYGYSAQIHFDEHSPVWIPANDLTACDTTILFPLPSHCPFLFRLASYTDGWPTIQGSEAGHFEQCHFIFSPTVLLFAAASSGSDSRDPCRWVFSRIRHEVLLRSLLSRFVVICIIGDSIRGVLGIRGIPMALRVVRPCWPPPSSFLRSSNHPSFPTALRGCHRFTAPGPDPGSCAGAARRPSPIDRHRPPLPAPTLVPASSPALRGRHRFTAPSPNTGSRSGAALPTDGKALAILVQPHAPDFAFIYTTSNTWYWYWPSAIYLQGS